MKTMIIADHDDRFKSFIVLLFFGRLFGLSNVIPPLFLFLLFLLFFCCIDHHRRSNSSLPFENSSKVHCCCCCCFLTSFHVSIASAASSLTWTNDVSYPIAIDSAVALAGQDHCIYVFGGQNRSYDYISSSYKFNVTDGSPRGWFLLIFHSVTHSYPQTRIIRSHCFLSFRMDFHCSNARWSLCSSWMCCQRWKIFHFRRIGN